MISKFHIQITHKEKIYFFLYIIIIIGLLFYSFTQIDLSLTVARIQFLKNIISSFQLVGYFNRPLSTGLYVSLLFALTFFYLFFFSKSAKKKISRRFIFVTSCFAALILLFSYNAFSYDIFNYIFDAKIVTHYGDNPYLQKALDYPKDPMLSFMRWTHREYPYGPVWLGVTIPLSFLGAQIFLITFFLFKLLAACAYLISIYCISKIMRLIAPDKEVQAITFFAFNPLVIIETLVSAHLDIVMIAIALIGLLFLLNKHHLKSYIFLFASVGIKFVTGFLLPIWLVIQRLQKMHKTQQIRRVLFLGLLMLVAAVILETNKSGNFQPWYLIVPLAFAAFVSDKYYILIPSFIISFFAMFTYVPFLYLGNWDPPIPQGLSDMYFLSYCLSFFTVCAYFLYNQIIFAKKLKKK